MSNGAHSEKVQTIIAHSLTQRQKKTAFALLIRVAGSCWVGEKGNYNQVSFAKTYVDATFYISLNESKFIKEYQNKISKWSQY
jgi:hypothetical protein